MRAVKLWKLPLALGDVSLRVRLCVHAQAPRQLLSRARDDSRVGKNRCIGFNGFGVSILILILIPVHLGGLRGRRRVHPRVHRGASEPIRVRHRPTPSLPRHLLAHHSLRVRLFARQIVLVLVAVVEVFRAGGVRGHRVAQAAFRGGRLGRVGARVLLGSLEDLDPRAAVVGDDAIDETRAPVREREHLEREHRGGRAVREPRRRGFGPGDDRQELRELHLAVRGDAHAGHGALGILHGRVRVAQHAKCFAHPRRVQRPRPGLVHQVEYLPDRRGSRPGDVGTGRFTPGPEPVRHLGGVTADHREWGPARSDSGFRAGKK